MFAYKYVRFDHGRLENYSKTCFKRRKQKISDLACLFSGTKMKKKKTLSLYAFINLRAEKKLADDKTV